MNRRTILTGTVLAVAAWGLTTAPAAEAGVYVSASYGYSSYGSPVVVSYPVYATPIVVSRPVYVAPAPVVVPPPVYVPPPTVVVRRTYYAGTYGPVIYPRPVRLVGYYHRPYGFGFRFGFHHH